MRKSLLDNERMNINAHNIVLDVILFFLFFWCFAPKKNKKNKTPQGTFPLCATQQHYKQQKMKTILR